MQQGPAEQVNFGEVVPVPGILPVLCPGRSPCVFEESDEAFLD